MFRNVCAALCIFAASALALTGCSGSTPEKTTSPTPAPTPSPSHKATVHINGYDVTCQQLIYPVRPSCDDATQEVFNRYKEDINPYVLSKKLGSLTPMQGFTYQDAAFVGLTACAVILNKDNEDAFVDTMLKEERFVSMLSERKDYHPAWLEAQQSLCPDLKVSN